MHLTIKNKFTTASLLLITIIFTWSCFNLKLWNKRPIEMDVFSYYVYLPAFFIENDIKLSFQGDPEKSQYNHLWYGLATNGNKITKMGIGTSYLYAPFFLIGHFAATLFNFPQDGFSRPYVISLIFGSIIYAVAGLYITSRILLFYFPDIVSGITIFIIGVGTNFLHYSTLELLVPHVYNFFLIGSFIYVVIKWHKSQTIHLSAIAGLLYGIIIVARPTNAIIILFPLLYNITTLTDVKNKFSLIRNNLQYLFIPILFMLIAILPQLFYWKYATGHFIYYSYNDETFYFNQPHIIEGLFGFRKGWLLYTPVMAFALAGFYFLFNKLPHLFWGISIFTIFNIYIIYSWWCWWYGGSFSSRPMVDSYTLMAIPLACIINYFILKKLMKRILSLTFLSLLVILNVFQTYQYKKNLIHYDAMTKDAYFAVFGKLSYPDNYFSLLKSPDYENAKNGRKEYE